MGFYCDPSKAPEKSSLLRTQIFDHNRTRSKAYGQYLHVDHSYTQHMTSDCNHSAKILRISAYTKFMSPRGCFICNTVNTSARVFLPARGDGLGAHFAQFVAQAGLAARAGINFGGFKGQVPLNMAHDVDIPRIFGDIFEQKLYFDEREFDSFQAYTASNWDDVRALVPKSIDSGRPIFCSCGEVGSAPRAGFIYLKSPIIDMLQKQGFRFKERNLHRLLFIQQGNAPTVSIHFRQARSADVQTQVQGVLTLAPLNFYQVVVSELLAVYPESDIHVFTSNSNVSLSATKFLKVHVDRNDNKMDAETELYKALVHFMSAEVFIIGKSNLSWLGLLFAGNQCIISGRNWFEPENWKPQNWIEVSDLESAAGHLRGQISSCLRRLNPLKYCDIAKFSC